MSFLGKDKRDYVRATSSQRVVRAGGKHNDLENVGYTARHHTFFEMLGNFSFGDYFKRDAIRFAWDFLTGTLKLDPRRLWVTIYKDDDEAAKIWLEEVGGTERPLYPPGREVHLLVHGGYRSLRTLQRDLLRSRSTDSGRPAGLSRRGRRSLCGNLESRVHAYERSADGKLTPLPKPSVDTGMGLERIAAVMQGVHSNYDIDLFKNLIRAAADLAGTTDLASELIACDRGPHSRLLVPHRRWSVAPRTRDAVTCIRRIIRRAVRHGYKLGIQDAFFYKLVPVLEREMGAAYPELKGGRSHVERVLKQEEERFAETLANGMSLLEGAIKNLKGNEIDGSTVFKLYDTYGFPADLTADIARERGLSIDQVGFDVAMEEQRKRSQDASKFGVDLRGGASIDSRTLFQGFEGLEALGHVVALLKAGAPVDSLKSGDQGEVILDRTPFYAESGGQVGDAGTLTGAAAGGARDAKLAKALSSLTLTPPASAAVSFVVDDTQKRGAAHSHIGRVTEGSIRIGDTLDAHVDGARRRATALNHSATHPVACGPPQGFGHTRAAEGLAGGSRSFALRFLALRADYVAGAA